MLKDLGPGDVFPDVELPDETGVLHRLSELQDFGRLGHRQQCFGQCD